MGNSKSLVGKNILVIVYANAQDLIRVMGTWKLYFHANTNAVLLSYIGKAD